MVASPRGAALREPRAAAFAGTMRGSEAHVSEPPTEALTLHLDGGQTPLAQLRALGGRPFDHPEQLPARAIDPAAWVPFEPTAEITLEGRPLVWLAKDGSEAAVDARAFGDLTCADAAGLPDEGVAVGRCTTEGLAPREVARLLILAYVVRANTHTTAEVTLVAEEGGRTVWESEDTFFTNQRNVVTYRFAIEVEAGGPLRVTPVR